MRMSHWMAAGSALAAAIMPQAVSAQEADGKGFYIGLDVGVASVGNADITYYDKGGTFGGTGPRDTFDGTFDADSAVNFGGVVGYDFGTIRSDLEIDYSRNKISAFTINRINGSTVTLTATDRAEACSYLQANSCGGSGNTFAFDGSRVRQLSAMANLWLDLPIGSMITPYAGGGVGISGFEVDGEGRTKFAWQLGAGVAANLSPTTALTLDFRHREVARTQVDYGNGSGFELGKLKTNTFSAGIRYTF